MAGRGARAAASDASSFIIMVAQMAVRSVPLGAVAAFRERLRGRLVSPQDAGYDAARKVWNGRIDRRPGLVAFCADRGEVAAAVRFAREHDILVSVRGGGHSCAGTAGPGDAPAPHLPLRDTVQGDAAARRAPCHG